MVRKILAQNGKWVLRHGSWDFKVDRKGWGDIGLSKGDGVGVNIGL